MTQEERRQKDTERLRGMYAEQREIAGGAGFIFGIDEAGRGPLCGPVVAACCLLPDGEEIPYLNDSKKLSPKRREEVFEEVKERCLTCGIGIAGPERIDAINILNATYEAMADAYRECLRRLEEQGTAMTALAEASVVLVDGNRRVPQIGDRQITVVSGDARCPAISAASVLAKVTRDRMMDEYDDLYPQYGIRKHKGYGTREHMDALRQYGPSPIHRMTFLKNLLHEDRN